MSRNTSISLGDHFEQIIEKSIDRISHEKMDIENYFYE